MKRYKTQVAIIGAGPAGLACAMFLARKGIDFICIDRKTLVDQFPYTCGYSWIDPERYGLTDDIYCNRYNTLSVSLPKYEIKLEIPDTIKCKVGYIDRGELYRQMFARAKKGGTFLFGENVIDYKTNETGEIVELVTEKNTIKSKIFIDGSGSYGFFARKFLGNSTGDKAIGLEYIYTNRNVDDSRKHLMMMVGKPFHGGYGWVAPMGDTTNIGIGKFHNSSELHLNDILDEYVKAHKEEFHLEKFIEKRGGLLPVILLPRFVYKNIIAVGDSCGQVNPVVGEGMRFILESSMLAVDAILKSIRNNDCCCLQEYEDTWNSKFRSIYKNGRMLQKLIRRMTFDRLFANQIAMNSFKYIPVNDLATIMKGEVTLDLLLRGVLRTLAGSLFKFKFLENNLHFISVKEKV